MKASVIQSAGMVVFPVLLLQAAGHASPSPIDWGHSCRPLDAERWELDHTGGPAAKLLTDSDAVVTRDVKLIYFIPNDRTFDSDVVDSIKVRIPRIQTFFRDQMQAHGYGDKTFQFETDAQGEPVVHRIDAPDSDKQLSPLVPHGRGRQRAQGSETGLRFQQQHSVHRRRPRHLRQSRLGQRGGLWRPSGKKQRLRPASRQLH